MEADSDMSVRVQELSKVFGTQRAVDQVSFQAREGEILGFLGPNGAGKSTCMKIITTFIPPTAGRVEVCGQDVQAYPLAVRRRIGYLPETNPLYRDMYVREYLRFIASLHRLKDARTRVQAMIEQTGLEREQHKRIGALFKGYRQRVGLAQALMHDPEVLILDEPTSGLDPNQLVEIRRLIRELGRKKTVIFSTHIMQEVQALCDRVLIISKGRIVANDPIERLQQRISGERQVTVTFAQPVRREALLKIRHVKAASELGDNRWKLSADGRHDIRPEVFRFAVHQKLTLLEMVQEQYSVEDVFQQLTR
jgi:ABC-2 type transport system ATP-binding protein